MINNITNSSSDGCNGATIMIMSMIITIVECKDMNNDSSANSNHNSKEDNFDFDNCDDNDAGGGNNNNTFSDHKNSNNNNNNDKDTNRIIIIMPSVTGITIIKFYVVYMTHTSSSSSLTIITTIITLPLTHFPIIISILNSSTTMTRAPFDVTPLFVHRSVPRPSDINAWPRNRHVQHCSTSINLDVNPCMCSVS